MEEKQQSIRRAVVANIISKADMLEINEEVVVKITEAAIERNIRSSLSRRKKEKGKVFEASMGRNSMTIKRIV